MGQPGLKRVNVYVNPDDLSKVAEELGCRPSEAVRRLIDNYLLAIEVDRVRQMPGRAPAEVFRKSRQHKFQTFEEEEVADSAE